MSVDERVILLESGFDARSRGVNGSRGRAASSSYSFASAFPPPFLLVGSCSLLPALSLDTPTPPTDEANLERCACAFCDAWEAADKREGAGRAACTPASQPP